VSAVRRVLFLFLDGVGLGADDPAVNPLAVAAYPTLARLLDGRKLIAATGRYSTAHATLVPTDANLGIGGRPQSATGQATILTGRNAPALLGEHYGPRPDDRVRGVLQQGTLFTRLPALGLRAHFCNGYPAGYFTAINRGQRLLSAIPYAATLAGQALPTAQSLRTGHALAADFTNTGWRAGMGYTDIPVYTPHAAGAQLWQIAQPYSFTFFEHWQTDLLGHRGDLAAAVANFQQFDGFLAGLLAAADLRETLILVAADHGNVEECDHGKHTTNPALTLVIGAEHDRWAAAITSLVDFVGVVEGFLFENATGLRPH
jgi:hypothetical protein